MSRPSRPGFLQPARSAPAPASVTNTNVTAAMVSVPGDIDIDGPDYHHDTEHRRGPGPGPGSVTAAPSTTGSTTTTTTTTTGRASSSGFPLPFFAGSSSSKRSTAPTVSSVSTAPQPLIPVPNAYTGQAVPVPPLAGTATTGSSTSGASTTAPAFPPASRSQSQTSRPGVQQPPHTPHTPHTPTVPGPNPGPLPTAQARTAVLASISNLLDRELTGRASLLHQNHNAILKQEREMSKAVEAFKKENDKLEKLAREGTKRLKEVGDVQNWAEVLERGFLRVEETIRRANGDFYRDYSEGSGSYSGSWSGSGSLWSGSEVGVGVGVGEGEGEGDDGKDSEGVGDGESKVKNGKEVGGSGSKSVEGEGAAEVENLNDDKREEKDVERDAEGDVVMTTEDDVQERHTRLDKGKGKAVDDTIPEPSMVPLPQSPGFGGGIQFPNLTPAAV
ncbi:hypothetical protein B0H65DRAFT_557897 [Neurospora tetraspora]|uniref:Biogenesis of lysosome-related organelles complex 1 subunit 1 n=1 Tax=Neurospora tetraspora TaxID=94610 RepID=A0AAE0MSP5_9PEZI|nr:hypothetical protein B0H65DRAFT_557897 [Neurospora tetraspora]